MWLCKYDITFRGTTSMMSSNGNIFHVTGPLWEESTGDRWFPLTKASDVELWCFLWINGWANNQDAGDLRHHHTHHDVTVMLLLVTFLYTVIMWSLTNRTVTTTNWAISQIPQCTCSISHNAPFRTEMCTSLFWMVHCGIWNKCTVGFVRLVYSMCLQTKWSTHYVMIIWHMVNGAIGYKYRLFFFHFCFGLFLGCSCNDITWTCWLHMKTATCDM